jgi:hypothetical protein
MKMKLYIISSLNVLQQNLSGAQLQYRLVQLTGLELHTVLLVVSPFSSSQ